MLSSFLASDVGIVLGVSQKIFEGKRVPWPDDTGKQWHNSTVIVNSFDSLLTIQIIICQINW